MLADVYQPSIRSYQLSRGPQQTANVAVSGPAASFKRGLCGDVFTTPSRTWHHITAFLTTPRAIATCGEVWRSSSALYIMSRWLLESLTWFRSDFAALNHSFKMWRPTKPRNDGCGCIPRAVLASKRTHHMRDKRKFQERTHILHNSYHRLNDALINRRDHSKKTAWKF